jgi:hypothetical protein
MDLALGLMVQWYASVMHGQPDCIDDKEMRYAKQQRKHLENSRTPVVYTFFTHFQVERQSFTL